MKSVSIVIPTYNPDKQLRDVLVAISKQSLAAKEVIIIDCSPNGDPAKSFAKEFSARFYKIDKKDFGHGKTRNLGVRLSKGQYVVFISQDALPKNDKWLEKLLAHLDQPEVIGAFSRQVARPDAIPSERFFYSLLYPAKSRVISAQDNGKGILLSNASSAFKRRFLIENPLDETILMSEDLELALRALKEGKNIYYEASSQVIHSHSYSPVSVFKRYFYFGVSHDQIGLKHGELSILKLGIYSFLLEIKYLLTHRYTTKIPQSITFNAAKFLGMELGRNHRLLPGYLKKKYSITYKEYWTQG